MVLQNKVYVVFNIYFIQAKIKEKTKVIAGWNLYRIKMVEYDCQFFLFLYIELEITSIPVAEIVDVTSIIPAVEVVALTRPAADVVTTTSAKTNTKNNGF